MYGNKSPPPPPGMSIITPLEPVEVTVTPEPVKNKSSALPLTLEPV